VIDAYRYQCHYASEVLVMLRDPQWIRAGDTEGVQQSPTEGPSAVVEVVHQICSSMEKST
jgi:hypothetical protein